MCSVKRYVNTCMNLTVNCFAYKVLKSHDLDATADAVYTGKA